MPADRRFPVMGTSAHVIVVDGDPDLADAAQARLEELEAAWSRFRDDSDVARLNGAGGTPLAVAAETVTLVETAVTAWAATGGAFDPTLYDALVAAGYDRTFVDLPADAAARPSPGPSPGCAGIVIDRAAGTVRLPSGVRLDPGGIGKGLAADIVVEELGHRAAGLCVDVGGDLRVSGIAPMGGAWHVGVDAVGGLVLRLTGGAVATSSTARRTWRSGGVRRHHLLDPSTGQVAATGLQTVTVVAGEGWWAQATATAALLGPTTTDARAALDGRVAAALLVTADGTIEAVGPIEESIPWTSTPRGTSPVPVGSSPGR